MRGTRTYWLVVMGLLLLTQYLAAARSLSIDNVNLAFAIEYFDPLNHQPQPPGYPFFVLLSKLLFRAVGSVEYTFFLISLAVTAACLPLAYMLAARMFSVSCARIVPVLLAVNPVFWQTGADSPLRPFLFLFSLIVAYCAWRCWHGEVLWLFIGAAALGVGSGFRPELLPYLYALWLTSAWMGSRSVSKCLLGTGIVAGIVLIWFTGLVVAVGGAAKLIGLLTSYLVEQSRQESPLMGADLRGWLRQVGRLAVWNGTAVFWWVWAVPILLWRRQSLLAATPSGFMALWILPGFTIQALTHAAAPGHTGATIPALCILGVHFLSAATRVPAPSPDGGPLRETFTGAAIALNVMVFLNFFPLPDTSTPAARNGGSSPSIRNMVAFALADTALGSIRGMDGIAFTTLKELREFTPADRPSILVTSDIHTEQWMLNWRIVRYYEPRRVIWSISDNSPGQPSALKVRRFDSLQSLSGESVSIPLPAGGRVLFLLDPKGRFKTELRKTIPLKEGQHVAYVDLPAGGVAFRVGGFEFVPASSSDLNSGQ